jgi:hypothetical protein
MPKLKMAIKSSFFENVIRKSLVYDECFILLLIIPNVIKFVKWPIKWKYRYKKKGDFYPYLRFPAMGTPKKEG